MELCGIITSVISIIIAVFGIKWNTICNFFRQFKKPVEFSFENDIFAEDTIKYRFRNIINDINNKYEDAVVKLRKNMIERPLDYDEFRDSAFQKPDYSNLTENPSDKKLLDDFYNQYDSVDNTEYKSTKYFLEKAPFIDVEHVFYFYIIDKLKSTLSEDVKQYMCDGMSDVFDPYKLMKKESIIKDLKKGINKEVHKSSRILMGLQTVTRFIKNDFSAEYTINDLVEDSIIQTLNSNSYDLSQLPGMERQKMKSLKQDTIGARDLINYLLTSERGTERTVNYLVDNAGVEFFSDLVLGYLLLKNSEYRIKEIIYHVNILPIFVSDVIENDLEYTFKIIKDYMNQVQDDINEKENFFAALRAIEDMFKEEKARINADFIWNMPTPYELISRKREIFENSSDLIIVKGDLNYRRLCGDKSYYYKKKIDNLTKYIKCPTLVVRSFKSNLVLDYSTKRYKQNTNEDKNWRTNGKYGVIKFMRKNG